MWKKHNTTQAAIIEQYLRAGAALPVYFIIRVVEDGYIDGVVSHSAGELVGDFEMRMW
jgi:hypothetical protein